MATSVTGQVDVDFLQAFADAWNRHDIEALMSFMADDCSFNSSMGPDALGTHYEGREQVREGYQELARREPERWHLIDAMRPVDEIESVVWAEIERRLPDGLGVSGDGDASLPLFSDGAEGQS